ncbi:tyrosine-type recombinase/integrase [Streptomyces albus]|uniref:tyrosine-type recombinase/integrase n=1 Tax=Streptomyces albus TaxID=1888 RepID=UPI003F1D4183
MPGSKVGDSLRTKGPTTNRVRRHEHSNDPEVPVGAFAPTAVQAAPPEPPAQPPRSLGDFSTASAEEIAEAAARHFRPDERERWKVRREMHDLLGHLAAFPGSTWQERWEASGHDAGRQVREAAGDNKRLGRRMNAAVGRAFVMRLIRPSLLGFRANGFSSYVPWFRSVARDSWLDEFCERADRLPVSAARRTRAKFDVCCALTVFGIDLKDLTPEGLLHYAVESRRHGLAGENPRSGTFAGTLAWPVLHEMGQFPPSTPRTLRAAVTRGQISVEEAVDRHHLRNRAVRDLLVEYIRRRSTGLDYSTLRQLSHLLAKVFWKSIEEINPDQVDLRLSEETVTQWKERLLTLPNGKPRLDMDNPLMAVRALYLDLHTWSVAEPERWAQWVAPCPIRDADLRHFQLRRRRLQERMANRTRDRQPLLPVLSQYVNDTWHRLKTLLEAAKQVSPGEEFTLEGTTWLRVSTNERHNRPPVRLVNRSTGELLRLSQEENIAFWQWAVVETLRLAGLRAEELTELTHLSVRQYQRPSGEVVALLVISPSKSDRERVIPMSAELFHVIAQIIRRHRDEHGTVQVCARYDLHEKVWSEELPYLFQTTHSGCQRAMSSTTVWRVIGRACERLAVTHPEFDGVKFAPHDFRRLFATELVNNGLPIHIGAALLGHLDIRTTRGYVAVFDEDVISQYQQFLARRRAERPTEEYRKPSREEWDDFQEHFDKRRVELGSCGRPYGTPCAHEHACVRCPMLSINPKMLPRLDELEEDLISRRKRAVEEGWQGEIEGLDLTLTFLRSKRQQTRRIQRSGPVELGIPHQRPPVTQE